MPFTTLKKWYRARREKRQICQHNKIMAQSNTGMSIFRCMERDEKGLWQWGQMIGCKHEKDVEGLWRIEDVVS
jgi:hypothetical protein